MKNLNRKCLTTGLFLDLLEAFDFVDHKLLEKIELEVQHCNGFHPIEIIGVNVLS